MNSREYLKKSTVAVIGGGNFGSVLANLAAKNCAEVRLWVREETQARAINATRSTKYIPHLPLDSKVKAISDIERIFEGGVQAVIWALPSKACRAQAKELSQYFSGEEILLHATKGVEEGTLKRISVILREELPCARIGVISGPNLADEIARGQPAACVVASQFEEVVQAGQALLSGPNFRVYGGRDVIGVEWAGTLKNIFAIAAGALDALNLGWNSRAMLMSRALAEMVRFGAAMGAKPETFLGLAGAGDLIATCSSNLSRNYRVGMKMAQGMNMEQILEELGSVAEGVTTTRVVYEYARHKGIDMPITQGVYHLIRGELAAAKVLSEVMSDTKYVGRPELEIS